MGHSVRHDITGSPTFCVFRTFLTGFEGVFAEKGARFRGKWGLGAPCPPLPQIPRTHPPLLEDPPPGIFSKTPTDPRGKGGGAGARGRGLGGGRGAEAPFAVKTSPFFGENAFFFWVLTLCIRFYFPVIYIYTKPGQPGSIFTHPSMADPICPSPSFTCQGKERVGKDLRTPARGWVRFVPLLAYPLKHALQSELHAASKVAVVDGVWLVTWRLVLPLFRLSGLSRQPSLHVGKQA